MRVAPASGMPSASNAESRSCLYECRVSHARVRPRPNAFAYGGFWFYLDLRELESAEPPGAPRLFGLRSRRVHRFRPSDHLDGRSATVGALRENLLAWLHTRGFPAAADARVGLLTLPACLGYVFNPVSFYFVSEAGAPPHVAVAEVGNTFRERKLFAVPSSDTGFRLRAPKHFYVSPFSPLDFEFDFQLREPGDELNLVVNTLGADGGLVLAGRIAGRRRPLTDRELARLDLRYPLMTLRVIGLIHAQAFKMWARRFPFFRKSANPELQRDLCLADPPMRPAASLRP
jgi:uncharacterized protein